MVRGPSRSEVLETKKGERQDQPELLIPALLFTSKSWYYPHVNICQPVPWCRDAWGTAGIPATVPCSPTAARLPDTSERPTRLPRNQAP